MMRVSFEARGHPRVRATHGKSIEITSDREITTRATCVIGVDAKLPATQLRQLRGRVNVVLSSRGATARIVGQVNPGYDSDSRLVLRRSGVDVTDTFVVYADKTAEDLPRELVDTLGNDSAILHVDIVEVEAPPPLVVIRPDRGRDWRAVDDVPTDVRELSVRAERVADLAAWPATVQLRERGARWLVDGFIGIDGPTAALLLSAGVALSPLLLAGDLPPKRRERDRLLRTAASSPYTVILCIPPDRAKPEGITEILGAHRPVVIGDGAIDHGWRARKLDAGDLDADSFARPPHLLVIPHQAASERLVIDPQLLARRLLDAGLTARSVDEVLRDLGFGRRFLYRA
jgi:hypothetical protein